MRSPVHVRPTVECLESRRLLAGNVSANIIKGNLILKGDADDNNVQITNTSPGVLEITGQAGTTINGSGLPAEFRGFTGNVVARFKAGTDSLFFSSAQLPGSLTFEGGAGINSLQVNNSEVARSVKFLGGSDTDSISLVNAGIGRNVVFKGAGGDDAFNLSSSHVGGNAVFNLGAGTTFTQGGTVAATVIYGNLKLRATGSIGAQFAIIGSTLLGATSVVTGGGQDTLGIVDSDFLKSFAAETGGGADTVSIATVTDDVFFNGKFDLKMQGGDDEVTLGDAGMFAAVFHSRARLNGGGGTNTLMEENVDMGPNYQVSNFGP